MIIEDVSPNVNLPILLASRIVAMIEDSGAAQTEVLAALGVVYSLLPTLRISVIGGEESAASEPQ
jgi:hypothetical protein